MTTIPSIGDIRCGCGVDGVTDRLQEALVRRETNRKEWSEVERERYTEWLSHLAVADGSLRDFYLEEIVKIVTGMVRNGQTAYHWKFLNCEIPSSVELKGIHPQTVVYGRYDRKRDRNDRLSRKEAGLALDFWSDVDSRLTGKGFHVQDISNERESRLKFVLITVGDAPPPLPRHTERPRRDREDRPRRDREDRPRHDREDRPRQDREDRPRQDREDRPPRRDREDRPPRQDREDRPPRKDREDRPRRDKEDRAPRRDREDRAPRRDREDRR